MVVDIALKVECKSPRLLKLAWKIIGTLATGQVLPLLATLSPYCFLPLQEHFVGSVVVVYRPLIAFHVADHLLKKISDMW
jgi:hypothetical protein